MMEGSINEDISVHDRCTSKPVSLHAFQYSTYLTKVRTVESLTWPGWLDKRDVGVNAVWPQTRG